MKKIEVEASKALPTLKLTEEEHKNFLNLQNMRAQLNSEMEKLELAQENVFLRASLRLGVDLTNYGVDLANKIFVKRPEAPPAPKA